MCTPPIHRDKFRPDRQAVRQEAYSLSSPVCAGAASVGLSLLSVVAVSVMVSVCVGDGVGDGVGLLLLLFC